MSGVMTILEGSTFVVSDDIGDVSDGAEGFFADDTRMLSRCSLRVDGESPLLLTSRATGRGVVAGADSRR